MKREEDRGEDDGGPTDQGGKNEVAEDNGGEGSEDEGSFQAKKDFGRCAVGLLFEMSTSK
jgi:hypothetical protein